MPLPSSYMCLLLSIVCAYLHRVVHWCYLFLPLLSSQWNSYSAIREHTGRSSPVRRNQLSLYVWWKISEIKFALRDLIALSCFFSLLSDFKVNTRNQYLLTSWNVFVCHFSICHCAPSYDQQRSGKIERDTVFISVLFGSQILLKDQILPKRLSLH